MAHAERYFAGDVQIYSQLHVIFNLDIVLTIPNTLGNMPKKTFVGMKV